MACQVSHLIWLTNMTTRESIICNKYICSDLKSLSRMQQDDNVVVALVIMIYFHVPLVLFLCNRFNHKICNIVGWGCATWPLFPTRTPKEALWFAIGASHGWLVIKKWRMMGDDHHGWTLLDTMEKTWLLRHEWLHQRLGFTDIYDPYINIYTSDLWQHAKGINTTKY